MKTYLIALYFAFFCCLPVSAQNPEMPVVNTVEDASSLPMEQELSGVTIENFGQVVPDIYRGAKPRTVEQYEYLHNELGVQTVVRFEYTGEGSYALCNQVKGLNCVQYPLLLFPGAAVAFNWETFRNAYRFILNESAAGKKVFIHCTHGSDRTGAMSSALMIREKACPLRGTGFDRDQLWTEIEATLHKHNFHHIYRSLHKRIKSWVFDFESNASWLCE